MHNYKELFFWALNCRELIFSRYNWKDLDVMNSLNSHTLFIV